MLDDLLAFINTGLLFALSGRTDAFVRFSNLLTVSGFPFAHFVIEVVAYLMVQNSVKSINYKMLSS